MSATREDLMDAADRIADTLSESLRPRGPAVFHVRNRPRGAYSSPAQTWIDARKFARAELLDDGDVAVYLDGLDSEFFVTFEEWERLLHFLLRLS